MCVSLDREEFVLPAVASTGVFGLVAMVARRLPGLDLGHSAVAGIEAIAHGFQPAVADVFPVRPGLPSLSTIEPCGGTGN
jgi:hypothetical protein